MIIESTFDEEEAMESIQPWHCYSDFCKTLKRFRNLDELCNDVGIDRQQVMSIIKYLDGVWGGFIIFKPKGLVG